VGAVALLVVGAMMAVACGSSSKKNNNTNAVAASTTTIPPQPGGTLTFGEFLEPAGLDSIVSTGHLSTGFVEMAAVYDTIQRYNHDTGKYENLTADNVTSNADFTEWTVKLKPNIKFTDGTPYDATAAVLNLNRHRSGLPGAPPCAQTYSCPRNTTSDTSYMSFVKDIQVMDPLTFKIILNQPWAGAQFMLAAEPGLVASPTALSKCDPAASIRTCDYNLHPVGAGPFMVTSFKPGEGITMVKNPNYYGGQVYLDGLKFINPGDGGGSKSYDYFKSGTVNAGVLRVAAATAAARADKTPNIDYPAQSGTTLLLNQGIDVVCTGGKPAPVCTGKPDGPTPSNPPTKDINVRKAVAAAIDPVAIDQRVNNGQGLPGSEFFQKSFKWYPNVPGPKYDINAAKAAVAAAKAAGWNGQVRLLFNNTPSGSATGLAIDAMLKAAGIDSQLDITKSGADMTVQYTQARDFDIVGTGFATSNDEGGYIAMLQNFYSTAASNRIGFKDPTVDKALDAIRVANGDSAKTAAFGQLATALDNTLPAVTYGASEYMIVYSPKVHGLMDTARDSIMFTHTWMEH
jgi:peptide/nickel transport system substrate-binding protein